MLDTDFVWHRSIDGYEWANPTTATRIAPEEVDDESVLRFRNPFGAPTYKPLSTEEGLFRTFAKTCPSGPAILDFAGHWGALQTGRVYNPYDDEVLRHLREAPNSPEFLSDSQAVAIEDRPETFELWRQQIHLMNASVEEFDRCQQAGPAEPAVLFRLQAVISQQTDGRTRLSYRAGGGGGFPQFRAAPKNLLGALWLQMGDAIAGNRRYRACESCGRWFELTPDANRTNKKFCKEACRSRALRHRIASAAQMHSEGKTLKQIAAELSSAPETVKGWIKKAGGPKRK